MSDSSNIVRVAGVTGWPVHMSLSPMLHNFWLKSAGIKGAYIPFAVRPDEALYAFKTLKRVSLAGVNVTMPLKRIALEAADAATDDARKLGVSNCLYVREGKLIAHNTDMEGFAAPLLKSIGHNFLINHPVVLIGAGGASRAVIGALLSLGVPEIRVINRTDQRAQDLVDSVAVPSLYALPWAQRSNAIQGAGLIINSSAGGMRGKPALDISVEGALTGAWVYDLVYNPLMTPLFKQAKDLGLNILSGLDMLIEQARPSFKAFYGQLPPVEADPKPMLIAHLKSQ